MRYVSGSPFPIGLGLSLVMLSALSACGVQLKLNRDLSALETAPVTIQYSGSPYTFSLSAASTTGAPVASDGVLTSCSVSPALPAGLTLSLSTCEISGTPTAVISATDFTVTPSSVSGVGTDTTISIEVVGTVPAITYSSGSYSFDVNQAATTGAPTNTGGTITGCSVAPALPTGLSLSAVNCTISGTPTVPTAAANYTVTPSNGVGNGAGVVVNITVTNTVPNITFSPTNFSFSLFNASSTTGTPTNSGGAITSCGVSPALPAGLSVSQTTCAISGTPSAVVSAANYTVTPANGVGSGSGVVISIEVLNVIPNIAYSSGTYTFDLNDAASTTTAPTNTGGAITNCTVSPALPTGLSINTSTCAISGTPTVVSAAANYTVTASNAIGNAAARTISIAVSNIVPNIAYSGSPYSFNLNAVSSSGTPTNTGGAITSCAVSPALPAGLSLHNTNCTISGTPTSVTANATYTITPTNGVGNGIGRAVDIAVLNVVPSLTYSSATYNFSLNSATSSTGTPTNAGGAMTNCTVSPALPAGLSINTTTCVVSGTPTAVTAAANYTITPSNGIGNGADVVLSIAVLNVVPSLTYSASVYQFDLNDAASTTGTPTNAGGAITGCSVSPALPTGLSISATTCAITGTPSAVTAAANYTITPSNGIGNGADVVLSIAVLNIVPNIAYSSASYSFTDGVSSTTGTPTNTGGAITSCGVSPSLPAGLSITATSCKISGSPSAVASNATYTITPANAIGSGAAATIDIEVVAACAAGSTVFTYTGSDQSFVVPANCTTVTVKVWGGGGGAANAYGGGGGGFATSILAVTPAESLTVMVGAGGPKWGSASNAAVYGGGGPGGYDDDNGVYGDFGGGRSEVNRAGTPLIIAGGGGGASSSVNASGGPGGGTTGVSGGGTTCTAGAGGSSSAGGTGGSGAANGASGSGGAGASSTSYIVPGGGGGGGYFGGGGGGASYPHYCGGGGGSSYTTGSSASTSSGSGVSAGNISDGDYAGNAGKGGSTSAGNPGRVVIIYGN